MSQSTIVKLRGETSERSFRVEPGSEARDALAHTLGVTSIRKLRFEGRLVPQGKSDWRLDGKLGATVVQPCVVTFAPVTTRIDVPVERQYLSDFPAIEPASEIEMPGDTTIEELPATLDLEQVMTEALALALPDFPRAEGVDPVEISVTEPGLSPMTDDDAKPFAGLADLKKRLEGSGDEND